MPCPERNTAGPKWSKNTNGPTIRVCTEGRARRTAKPSPRSTVRGAITCATASLSAALPGAGSLPGKKLIGSLLHNETELAVVVLGGQRDEFLALNSFHQPIECLVDL